ncbi:LacI family DNA-binding transcriptional regulator [Luteimicrobium sp. NPDC057192]|uniref:LacI family DNA-binding transcriptional regulator n=1 Tax=Luteimicrobium sp. NPDC057192 TaxID=3346042 RepID=UPI003637D10F
MTDDLQHAAMPTLEDVARVAGVSRASVSRVVNGKPGVAPHIVEAVQKAVATTRYVPNTAARSLVTRQSGSVAIVVSGVGVDHDASPEEVYGDPFFGRLSSALVRALSRRELHPVLMLAESDSERDRVEAFLARRGADGALLISTAPHDPLPGLLVDAGHPVVTFSRPPDGVRADWVDVGHRQGAALAAERLVGRGVRRPAVISGPLDVPAAAERLAGFLEGMARHGHSYVPVVTGTFTVESGEQAMRELLEQRSDLDGVFAANDLMAVGALHALTDAGRAVPGDVAVVGFDDSFPARYARPALTTVRQPLEDMGEAMVDLLVERVAAPGAPARSRVFAPTLQVRASA